MFAFFKEDTPLSAPGRFGDRFHVKKKVPVTDSQVYVCEDRREHKEVILKAEEIGGERRVRIRDEYNLYKKLKSCPEFDIVKEYFVGYHHRFLILEKRGIDLRRHFHQQRESGQWRDHYLSRYAVQMIDSLRKCHSLGILHLDPKPNNYVLDLNDSSKVYLIDFDYAKEFVDQNGEHIPFRTNCEVRGNRTYISIHGHEMKEQSRRDDMIFLGYSFIWMARNGLPWSEKKSTDFTSNREFNQYIKNEKLRYSLQELCRSREGKQFPALVQYMQYCYDLEFADEPDYRYLISLFTASEE